MDEPSQDGDNSVSDRAESTDDGNDDDQRSRDDNEETGDDSDSAAAADEDVQGELLDYDEEQRADANVDNELDQAEDEASESRASSITFQQQAGFNRSDDNCQRTKDNVDDDTHQITNHNSDGKNDNETEEGEIDDLEEGELKSDGDEEEEGEEGDEDNDDSRKSSPPRSKLPKNRSLCDRLSIKYDEVLPTTADSIANGMRPEDVGFCKFYLRGTCTWGTTCKFIHPAGQERAQWRLSDHGDSSEEPTIRLSKSEKRRRNRRENQIGCNQWMTASSHLDPFPVPLMQAAVRRPTGPSLSAGSSFPPALGPPIPLLARTIRNPLTRADESAWERGLKQARELMRKANEKREAEGDFEVKRLVLPPSDDDDMHRRRSTLDDGDDSDGERNHNVRPSFDLVDSVGRQGALDECFRSRDTLDADWALANKKNLRRDNSLTANHRTLDPGKAMCVLRPQVLYPMRDRRSRGSGGNRSDSPPRRSSTRTRSHSGEAGRRYRSGNDARNSRSPNSRRRRTPHDANLSHVNLSISPPGKSPISSDEDEENDHEFKSALASSPPRAFALSTIFNNSSAEIQDPWDRSTHKRRRTNQSSSGASSRSGSLPRNGKTGATTNSDLSKHRTSQMHREDEKMKNSVTAPHRRHGRIYVSSSNKKADDLQQQKCEAESRAIAVSPSSATSDVDDEVVAAPISSDDEDVEKHAERDSLSSSRMNVGYRRSPERHENRRRVENNSRKRQRSPTPDSGDNDRPQKEARRAELLRQLQAVEEAIARKRGSKKITDSSNTVH